MIITDCPYEDCNETDLISLYPGDLPKFQKRTCDKCGRRIWTIHSRLNPQSFTEQQFNELYILDEADHSITPRTVEVVS